MIRLSGSLTVRRNVFPAAGVMLVRRSREFVGALGPDIVTSAQAVLVPGHGYRTGALHDSIHFIPAPDGLSGTVVAEVPYAGIIEDRYHYLAIGVGTATPRQIDAFKDHIRHLDR